MATYPGAIEFSLFTGAPDPLVDGFQEGGAATPATGRQNCPKTWGVQEIKLTCGASSTSFDDRGHEPIPAGRAGHFFFAPIEDSVTVSWKLKQGANAETMVMELFRAGSGAPIWRRTLDSAAAQEEAFAEAWKGNFPGNEWIDTARFPHGLVTAADSPYLLKIRAEGSDVEDGFVERFTYFDVIVDSLALEWGGAALLPAGAPADVAGEYSVDTRASEEAIVNGLAAKAIDAERLDVVLPCDTFLSEAGQMKGNYLFERHKAQWGSGPRIPLLAKIAIAKAGGGAVQGGESAKALGPLDILWDWESEDETALLAARYPTAAVRTYLGTKLVHARNDGTGPPGSTNCHVAHGGKRGGGGVFPTANGAFPYAVTACAARVWASTSRPLLEGDGAGSAGAIFQPSRMARDTYKVSAWVARVNGEAVLDRTDAAETLRQDYPDLPTAATGLFEVVREVHARYIRKAPSVEAADVNAASAQHALAGVRLVWSATEDGAFQAAYAGYIDRMQNRTLLDKDGVARATAGAPVPQWMEEMHYAFDLDQSAATTHAVLTAWEYAVFREKHLIDAIRDYVNKDRFYNGPKRAYRRWRNQAGADADDSQYLLDFYDGLAAGKQAQVDNALQATLAGLGAADEAAYKDRCALVGCHVLKRAGSQYLIETATAANRGFVTFHAVDTVRFKLRNGGYEIVPSSHGGLAPSFETLTDKRHTLLLIYLPTTVRGGVVNHYTVGAQPVIAHEAGHTFFLCHAPADMNKPGVREAGGFSRKHHDPADLLCLMNYDFDSDHLCGLCNLKLRGWDLEGMGVLA